MCFAPVPTYPVINSTASLEQRPLPLSVHTIQPFKGPVHTVVALHENVTSDMYLSVYGECEQRKIRLSVVAVTAAY